MKAAEAAEDLADGLDAILRELQHEFTVEQVEDLKTHFTFYDADKDGVISKHDLAEVMARLGKVAVEEDTLLKMIAEVAHSDDPTTAADDTAATASTEISFAQYAEHMGRKWSSPPKSAPPGALRSDPGGELQRVFEIIDRDRDGKINQQDIESFLKLWGRDWEAMHQASARKGDRKTVARA